MVCRALHPLHGVSTAVLRCAPELVELVLYTRAWHPALRPARCCASARRAGAHGTLGSKMCTSRSMSASRAGCCYLQGCWAQQPHKILGAGRRADPSLAGMCCWAHEKTAQQAGPHRSASPERLVSVMLMSKRW